MHSLIACSHLFSEVAVTKSSFTSKKTLAHLQLPSGSARLKPRALDPKPKGPRGESQLAKRWR